MEAVKKEQPKTKVITTKVRFSYLNVFEARAVQEGQDKKYSVSLIIPKTDKELLKKIKAAITFAAEEGKTKKFGGKVPANLKTPLRDGDVDRPDDEAYAGCYFIAANNKTKPGLVDKNGHTYLNEDDAKQEFYSGIYGRASINFFAFNTAGNKGIACGLNGLQKLSDGEPLSGRASAEQDFGSEPYEGGDDDNDLL